MSRGRPLALIDISYEELGEYVGRRGMVKVSKLWLNNLTGDFEPCSDPVEVNSEESKEEPAQKVEFQLTDLNNE